MYGMGCGVEWGGGTTVLCAKEKCAWRELENNDAFARALRKNTHVPRDSFFSAAEIVGSASSSDVNDCAHITVGCRKGPHLALEQRNTTPVHMRVQKVWCVIWLCDVAEWLATRLS